MAATEVFGFVATFCPNGPKDQGLVIRDITQDACSATARWNAEHSNQRQISAGQVILEVNGHRETPDMLKEVHEANCLEMLITDQLTPLQKEILRVSRRKSEIMAKVESIVQNVVPEGEVESCSICFDDMDKMSHVVQLPCGHRFHKKCVTKWLSSGEPRQRCPLCNLKIEMPS